METAGTFELPSDLVAAVQRVFRPSEVDDVLGWLRRAESDRIAVAVLVGATCGAKPDARKIRQGIELSFVDFRDVLMNEYDERIDYKAALRHLGLHRPYPVYLFTTAPPVCALAPVPVGAHLGARANPS
jgi:hypothetical protein